VYTGSYSLLGVESWAVWEKNVTSANIDCLYTGVSYFLIYYILLYILLRTVAEGHLFVIVLM